MRGDTRQERLRAHLYKQAQEELGDPCTCKGFGTCEGCKRVEARAEELWEAHRDA